MRNGKSDLSGIFGLCFGYFFFYTFYGLFIKWLLDKRDGFPAMPGMEVLFHTTLGGTAICVAVVLLFWWPGRLKSTMPRIWGGRLPGEYAWLIPSGICTGFVIPTTTLMYTYGYSVMVAMVLMRASLVVASRVVDAILIRQGFLTKKVFWQEDAAVLLAVGAISVVLFGAGPDDFQFFGSPAAMITMVCYIFPYSLRIYILNRFKISVDHRAIFGIEQIFASLTIVIGTIAAVLFVRAGVQAPQVVDYVRGLQHPDPAGIMIGVPYGIGAFFSVFLFLYKGGTATFNTTMNRLTSLVAGTAATLGFFYLFQGKPVASHEWTALAIVVTAIGFLGWAGRRRQQEAALAR